jgi:Leucine-rich repeat (LRR) protein
MTDEISNLNVAVAHTRVGVFLRSDVVPRLLRANTFTNLKSLDLEGTQVGDVTPLAGLANLKRLYLSWAAPLCADASVVKR